MFPALRAGMRRAFQVEHMGSTQTSNEGWTIPLHVIMWTTIGVGLIMAIVVVLMN